MVQRYIPKTPIYEAMRLEGDPDVILEISNWLSDNEYPFLALEDREGTPSPSRVQGHWIEPEGSQLIIQWPEDMMNVQHGLWIVKNRRYNNLEFLSEEDFSYNYEQYGS